MLLKLAHWSSFFSGNKSTHQLQHPISGVFAIQHRPLPTLARTFHSSLQRHGFSTTTCRPFLNVPHSRASSRRRCMQVTAQFTRRSRLATQITTVPRRLDAYFAGSILRQALWTCIAFFAGFYAANTVSLSFGALSINDVVAAAVTVAYVEVTSYIYYQADVVTLKLQFANSFKLGVVAALLADAMKLQG
ncbi:hypothetical protein WJX72_004830 [[Myrmecia] bisecta]|uniref:Uncharacterized protein n=1 Tax=[Myrmecia] bisecta TaxID=41462 RepID=A0AAW1P4K1_9CHLO